MLRIYDTLRKKKVEFRPRDGIKVMMYACGPTTYDHAHMGHARTAMFFDFFRRYLEMKGYFVVYASNVTDIDDKVINRGKELGVEPVSLARMYAKEYFRDMDALRVRRPNITPYATDHIPEIIEFVEGLIEKGYAYESDGDVYFSVEKFPEYGKLSGRRPEEMLAGYSRVSTDKKRSPLDFALWKAAKEGEPAWPSPWGPGRPGWHIECSAMNYRYFGPTLDVHGGGTDLIFPHHENEIAQSEALTGRPFALHWVHTGMLNVNREKMSKSLRNYFLVREVLKGWRPEVIRVALLNAHYRTPLEYSTDVLEEARKVHDKIWGAWQSLPSEGEGERENRWVEKLVEILNDDLNTRKAFTLALEAVAKETDAAALRGFLEVFDALFSVIPVETGGGNENALIDLLVEVRDRARKKRDYEMADYIRDALREMGILLEDTKEGTRWRRA